MCVAIRMLVCRSSDRALSGDKVVFLMRVYGAYRFYLVCVLMAR